MIITYSNHPTNFSCTHRHGPAGLLTAVLFCLFAAEFVISPFGVKIANSYYRGIFQLGVSSLPKGLTAYKYVSTMDITQLI